MNNELIYNNNFTGTTKSKGHCVGSIKFTFSRRSEYTSGKIKLVDAIRRMVRLSNSESPTMAQKINYTRLFNDWINSCSVQRKTRDITHHPNTCSGGRARTSERVRYELLFMDGMLTIVCETHSWNSRDFGKLYMKEIVIGVCSLSVAQMEETQQGEATQESDKANNTIVTRDAAKTEQIEKGISLMKLENICSTEPVHTFDSISNRWMALPSIEVTTNKAFNTILQTYNLPSFLYSENSAPNMMPFQNFLYGKYEIVFKFVVNANKFHVGKVVASVKYDSYQIDTLYNDVTSMLCRPHVIMDLAANNEAVLGVPFKYHRTFARNASLYNSQNGSKAAQYATITVSVLSPLQAIAGAPTSMYIRPFYTIRKGTFTGMSYKVPLAQMEDIAHGARVFENALKFLGNIPNMDKPYDDQRVSQVVVRPRINFQSGKGVSDCVPLRVDPLAQTTFLPDHEYPEDPTDVISIAKIWGFAGSFEWKAESAEGTSLFDIPIEPTWRQRSNWDGVPTPLEYVSSMYQFWSGPLEIRLDFVSNAFHTGTVMLSAEFGRVSTQVEQSSSTYTKVFHLGEQKSVSFVIPYIYDTVWRRTASVPWCPLSTTVESKPKAGQVAVLRANSSAFKVRVINKLVPVQSVVQDIKVLVYIRGGDQFTLHSPIMANMLNSHAGYTLVNFPGEFSTVAAARTSRVSLDTSVREKGSIQVSHKWMKGRTPKEIRNLTLVKKGATEPRASVNSEPKFMDGLPISRSSDYVWVLTDSTTVPWVMDVSLPEGAISFVAPEVKSNGSFNKEDWTWGPALQQYKYHTRKKGIEVVMRTAADKTQVFYVVLPTSVHAQMDSGEKEDLDPTDNFNQGPSRQGVQTVESHLNIKDLLRRPVCIVSNYTISKFEGETSSTMFFVPCMPPSHMLAFGSTANEIFAPYIGRSMTTHLLDMFRFWRGSQRYQIISSRTTGAPIYAAYIPHSGAMIAGNVSYLNSELLDHQFSPACFGLSTEVMIPSLNPTMAIEVPYETEENWTLMMCENWERNFSWRDKGDYNCGHFLLWSTEDFKVDIFWSAGDDFKVANFLGPPTCVAPFSKYFYTDNYPSAQMEDFRPRETKKGVSSFLKSLVFPASVAVASQVPVIGPTIAMTAVGTRVNNQVERVSAQVDEVIGRSNQVLGSIDDILDLLKQKLSGLFDTTSAVFTATINGLIDLLMNMGSWDPKKIGLAILRFVANITSYPIVKVMDFIPTLSHLFRVSPVAQGDIPIEQISGSFWTEDRIKEGLKVFIGLIGMMAGAVAKCSSFDIVTLAKNVIKAPFDYQNILLANHLMTFVNTTFAIIKEAVLWVLAKISPEARIVSMLRQESVEINDFVNESQILTNEVNKSCFTHPSFRLRYWVNVLKAYEIQKRLIGMPNSKVSSTLSRVCSDVIRQGKENMADLKCSPIKYEPFVVCIEGEAGIGKSMLVRSLATKMLHKIGITSFSGDPIYYRISGSRYWNGYSEQPVVIYDDWMNVMEPTIMAQVLNELYQLKSCATFVPEQAAIEEKKIKATPRIVILLCNRAFPDAALINMVGCREAVYRRRDILVRASLKPEYYRRNLRTLTSEESLKMDHMYFEEYTDPCDRASLSSNQVDYETFLDSVLDRFTTYNEQELTNVKNRMNELLTFFSQTRINLRDPFSVFYSGIQSVTSTSDSFYPSDQLEEQIRLIAANLDRVEENVGTPTSDEVEAQISFQAVSVGVMAVSTIVPFVIDSINSFMNYISNKYFSDGVIAKCCICLEDTSVNYVCSESWLTVRSQSLDGLHKYCEPCYQRLALRGYKCGVCRSNRAVYRIISRESYESTVALAKLYRGANYCKNTLMKAIEILKNKVGLGRFMAIIAGTGFISSSITNIQRTTGHPDIAPLLLYNCFSSVGVFTSIYFTFKAARAPWVAEEVVVDPTVGLRVPDIISFDDGSKELQLRIQAYNSDRNKSQEAYRALMGQYRSLFRTRMGNLELYCEPISGVFLTEAILDINYQIGRYNSEVMVKGRQAELTVYNEQKRHLENLKRPHMPTEAQIGGLTPYPVRHFNRAPVIDMRNVYQYNFNPLKVDFGSADNTVCPHQVMFDSPENVTYECGSYYINSEQGLVVLPQACSCLGQCPLVDPVRSVEVAQKIFDYNKDAWFSWILSLEEPTRIAQIKTYLPEYAWPGWINMNPIVLDSQITSDDWYTRLQIPQFFKVVLTGLAVGAGALLIMKSISGILNLFSPAAQIIPSGDAVIRHFKPKLQRVTRPSVVAQSEVQEAICDKINNNYFVIIVNIDGKDERFLNGVGIKQRLGLIPRHYYTYLRETVKKINVTLFIARPHNVTQRVAMAFCESDFTYSETADICIFQLPQSWNMFKDLTKYMTTDADLTKKMANTGLILTPPLRSGNMTKMIPIDIKEYVKRRFILSESGGYESEHSLSYTYSKKGACGSLVLKDFSQRPIVAMHIAGQGEGTSGTGYGVLLTKEMFDEFTCDISGSAKEYDVVEQLEDCESLKVHLPADAVVTYEGKLPQELVPFSPSKTKIKPSLIQNELPWKPIKQPAILSNRDPRYNHAISPLIAGAAKHGYLTRNFAHDTLNKVQNIRLQQLLMSKPHVIPTMRLNVEEAIVGFDGLPYYDPLHLDTSAGWPYCTQARTLKKDYCVIERNEAGRVQKVVLHDTVKSKIVETTRLRRQGLVPATIFVDTLKDEKRKPEKLLALGGTRVFCASPFDFSVCMRQNFLHFVATYMQNRWNLKHSVGINLQGQECTQLVSKLLSIGNNIVTIDYSNFGPGFNAGVARAAAKNIVEWTLENVTGIEKSELDCLVEENLNSLHCLNHLVYRQMGGSPSGSPITVIINSEVNIIYIMLAWDHLVTESNKWEIFEEKVCLFVYGDDLIMSVADDYIERFNATTITDFFKKFDIVATDASKSKDIISFTGIDQATFLKCNFAPHPTRKGEWIAQLAEDSVKDTAMWIKEELSFKEATRVNGEAAIRAAYGYGKEYFDEMLQNINRALRKKNIQPILLDWHELDVMFYGE